MKADLLESGTTSNKKGQAPLSLYIKKRGGAVPSFPAISENGINERCDGRGLGEDDQNAQQQQDDEYRRQPESLAHFQKAPEFFDGGCLGHSLFLG